MKRRIILTLVVAILAVSFVGCGNGIGEDVPSTPPTATPVNFDTVETQQGVNELYQLVDTPDSQIMSYILKTKNGKLIILDGGLERNAEEIIALAKRLTGQEVPEIEAWFFSHSHSDHVNAFTKFATDFKDALSVKKIYHHFTSDSYVVVQELGNVPTYRKFMKALTAYDSDGSKTTVVEPGDVYSFDDVTMEVLLVPDEEVEVQKGVAINEASVIYRMTIDGQRVLFLGDAYHVAGQRLQAAYPDDLKADVVQMAHHGSQGVEWDLYALIQPKMCLWPSPQIMWAPENQIGGSANWGLETVELHRYMRTTLGVSHHYIATEGLQKLVFPLDLE